MNQRKTNKTTKAVSILLTVITVISSINISLPVFAESMAGEEERYQISSEPAQTSGRAETYISVETDHSDTYRFTGIATEDETKQPACPHTGNFGGG